MKREDAYWAVDTFVVEGVPIVLAADVSGKVQVSVAVEGKEI